MGQLNTGSNDLRYFHVKLESEGQVALHKEEWV